MNRGKMVATIKSRLGNRNDTTINAMIVNELDVAQELLETSGQFLPWFLEITAEEATPIDVAADSQTFQLPANFLAEFERTAVYCDGRLLEKYDHDTLLEKYPGTGVVEAYALGSSLITLAQIPASGCSIKVGYIAADTMPSDLANDAGENLWMKHAPMLLLSIAGEATARYIKDVEAAALFKQDAQTATDSLYRKHIARQEDNRTRSMEDE